MMLYKRENQAMYQIEVRFKEKSELEGVDGENLGFILMTDGDKIETMAVTLKKDMTKLVEVQRCQQDDNMTLEMLINEKALEEILGDTFIGMYTLYYGFGLALFFDQKEELKHLLVIGFITSRIKGALLECAEGFGC